MVPKTEISEAVRGALQVLDQKRYSYGDCLRDPDLAAAGLRVLNVLGLLSDGPGLLAQIIDHFIKDVEQAFAQAPPRDKEQIPEIIEGMKGALPSAEELAETKNAFSAHFVGMISEGDAAWQLERPELTKAYATEEFIYNMLNHW